MIHYLRTMLIIYYTTLDNLQLALSFLYHVIVILTYTTILFIVWSNR